MSLLSHLVASARRRLAVGGQPLRFLIAGGINTVFGLSFYPLLLWSVPQLHRQYMLGLVIAQGVSLSFAFTVYKLTVFRTRGALLREFSRFLPFYLVNYAINWATLPLLVRGAGLDPIVAQFGFTVVLIVGSYLWHSRVTFRPKAPAR